MLKLDEWGTLGACLNNGDGDEQFDLFIKEQDIPQERVQEFRAAWNYLKDWKQKNPGVQMDFPTD